MFWLTGSDTMTYEEQHHEKMQMTVCTRVEYHFSNSSMLVLAAVHHIAKDYIRQAKL